MKNAGAVLWLLVVVLVVAYLGFRFVSGLNLQSSILALLPNSQRDENAQRIQDRIAATISRRVVILVGRQNPDAAYRSARSLSSALVQSGLVRAGPAQDSQAATRQLAGLYFADRAYLLSQSDREHLLAGQASPILNRALSILYGPGGFASGQLIRHDPFLLLPSFLAGLPLTQSQMSLNHGLLSVQDNRMTFVVLNLNLAGDPYSINFQDKFVSLEEATEWRLSGSEPGLKVLRLGAVFYAQAGTAEAMGETSSIGFASMLGTLGLILVTFRAVRPIVLGFIAISTGMLCAIAGTLLIFGNLHVIALLFGVSLIGISVDYCLQYFCEYFDPGAKGPSSRLVRVLPGVAMGVATTIIGYLTLLLAPFPGLRQVAVLSVIGIAASSLTVVLWFPILDRQKSPGLGDALVRAASRHWELWQKRSYGAARWAIVLVCGSMGIVGAMFLHSDDDVHHLQSLSVPLQQQEAEIRRLTGLGGDSQFLLVRASDEQSLLRKEESISPLLDRAERAGWLAGYRAMSQFIPSVTRQKQNWELVHNDLVLPRLRTYLAQLNFVGAIDYPEPTSPITPSNIPHEGALSILSSLDVSTSQNPAHIVMLSGVHDSEGLRALAGRISGIAMMDPAADWSRLFGTYRRYALGLLVLSAALMYPLLSWRYGWIGAARVMVPSVVAAGLTPPIIALFGTQLSFFNTMALVLVLSIGVDYSVFCRETSGERKPVTMLAVGLAASSSLLTFGLLALSRVYAVHAFGITMLVGILLAFLFAPIAGEARPIVGSR
jgi:predicted exporter